jgi:diguanylate cyclase (GGDEF)-like protein
VLTLVLGLVGTEFFLRVDMQSVKAFQRIELINKANELRYEVEREINTKLQLSYGLIINVASNPNIDDKAFAVVAEALISRAPDILNIGLAKDNVISHIFPLSGNEKALGLDYLATPSQRDSVLLAIQEKATVVAGPVNLVQGGRGMIGRIPIFLSKPKDSYWGMASVVIDFEHFQEFILQRAESLDIQVALKGNNATGLSGDTFIGNDELFSAQGNSLINSISLPVGNWAMAVTDIAPRDNTARVIMIRTLGYAIALLISLLVFLLIKALHAQRHLSLHDSLTGLPNRRLFDIQIKYALLRAKRYKSIFGLVYIDLNNFKNINDTYGHKAGDTALIHAATQIKKAVRKLDFITRVGGDEFLVILEDIGDYEHAQSVVDKIAEKLLNILVLGDEEIIVSASLGLVIYPDDGEDVESLLRNADGRMYDMKGR